MRKKTRQEQRSEHAFSIDEELRMRDEIEDMLEHEVRYLWRRTREMADHDGFSDSTDPLTGEKFGVGCDCNVWNKIQLKEAIKRLRVWRQQRSFCV
jgi:hypothetical protein